jgi:hypothetical protein
MAVPAAEFLAALAATDDAAGFRRLEQVPGERLADLRVFRVGSSGPVDVNPLGRVGRVARPAHHVRRDLSRRAGAGALEGRRSC